MSNMKCAHSTIPLLIFLFQARLSALFIIRNYDISSLFPQVQLFTDAYEYALQEAEKKITLFYTEPETNMTTIDLIKHLGYPAEAHQITTEDGYILEIHRIPNNEVAGTSTKKLPVLLQHGLLASSADWVINLKNQSLGYMLSDAGYDVWLGNIRGNTYCHKHVNLTSKDYKFWEFSWDEMAEFDVPAMIDYILNTTGHNQLYYVGHSMGTTMAFAMLATKAQYNYKIKTMFAMGPVVTLNHTKGKIIKNAAPRYKEIMLLFRTLGFNEFLPNNHLLKYLVEKLCHKPSVALCMDILYSAFGEDQKEFNVTRLPIYLTHTPAGASLQTLAHYAQVFNAKQWQHYDWGFFTNFLKYGTLRPPKYDLAKIKTPVVIFYGLNDPLADPEDVDFLCSHLQNLVGKYQIGGKNWNHIDFLWAIDAGKLVNKKLIDMLGAGKRLTMKFNSPT